MFDVPPPDDGGLRSIVEILKVVVDVIWLRFVAWERNTLGLSTICCVTWGMSADGVRRVDGLLRFVSAGNGTRLAGFPITNGVMLTVAKDGT